MVRVIIIVVEYGMELEGLIWCGLGFFKMTRISSCDVLETGFHGLFIGRRFRLLKNCTLQIAAVASTIKGRFERGVDTLWEGRSNRPFNHLYDS
jgi:hypothetical protein